jgi:CubicO group peptidase (beta-lactamase class C family)
MNTSNPNSKLDRKAVLAARQCRVPARSGGWLGGFGNMLRCAAIPALALLAVAGCGLIGQGGASTPAQTTEQEMETFLQAHLATGNFIGSVLVARGDEVLQSGGYGMANLEHDVPNTPQTVFRLASLTKQFTAAAILQLQERGLLDVNDTIARHLPDYPHGEEITIHQLLNHTSGIPDYEYFPDIEGTIRQTVSFNDLIATFSNMPLEFAPGSQYKYSNSGYAVLTRIIEESSGQPYAGYLAEHIFRPLGLDSTGYDDSGAILPHRAEGYVLAGEVYRNANFIDMSNLAGAGGLYSTVLDLYKWDRALYSGDVLGESSREAYFTPTADVGEGMGYAYGWGVFEISGRKYTLHGGDMSGFSTFAIRYRDEELYVAVLSNLETANSGVVALGLAAIALGDPYEMPGQRTAVEVDPAVYEKYAGSYRVTPDLVLTITTEAGHIFGQPTNQPRFEIFPESETNFFARLADTDIQLHFQVGADARVTGVIVLQGGQEIQAEKVE